MYSISKTDFLEYAKKYDYILMQKEVIGDVITPISLLKHFKDEKYSFLLESCNSDKTFSRFSYFGKNPSKIFNFKNRVLYIQQENGESVEIKDVNGVDYFENEIYKTNSINTDSSIGDFNGGYVGFFSYDSVNYMKVLRKPIRESEDQSTLFFMKIDDFYVFDNHLGKFYLVSVIKNDGSDNLYEKAVSRLEVLQKDIDGFVVSNKSEHTKIGEETKKEFTALEYEDKIINIKKEIEDGEAIQVVFSRKFEREYGGDRVELYRILRNSNPSPYMFYINFDGETLFGTSPETHLKVKDNIATLKPIAGTYPIDDDIEAVKKKLLADKKEVSEHLMLLDLGRNDLYTSCELDSIVVESSFSPEVYSHLVHIESVITGKLKKDCTPLRLFTKTFPAGTLSGAPKVRAMELIDKYEKSPRGFYAGCVGYFSYTKDLDTCITIRSVHIKDNIATYRAGGGIVFDSVPENERAEVENKLGAITDALNKLGSVK